MIALLFALWLYIPVHAVIGAALADPLPVVQQENAL